MEKDLLTIDDWNNYIYKKNRTFRFMYLERKIAKYKKNITKGYSI